MPSFLSVLEELCTSSRVEGGTCGAADDRIHILGKAESQDPEFEKEYYVMPNEMGKLIRELPCDTRLIGKARVFCAGI